MIGFFFHFSFFFFFNDTATTEIYTLSLHDALPIYPGKDATGVDWGRLATAVDTIVVLMGVKSLPRIVRSEEHTSELQSHLNLVCRLLLEKKKKKRSGAEMKPRQL